MMRIFLSITMLVAISLIPINSYPDELRREPIQLSSVSIVPSIDSLEGFKKRHRNAGRAADFTYGLMSGLFDYGHQRNMRASLEKEMTRSWVNTQKQGFKGMLFQAKAYELCDPNGCRVRYAGDNYIFIANGNHPIVALAKQINGDVTESSGSLQILGDGFHRKPASDHYVWLQSDETGKKVEVHKWSGDRLRVDAQKILSEKFLYEETLQREKLNVVENRLIHYSNNAKSWTNRRYLRNLIRSRQQSLQKLEQLNHELEEATEEAIKSNNLAKRFSTISGILGVSAAIGQAVSEMGNQSRWNDIEAQLASTGDEINAIKKGVELSQRIASEHKVQLDTLRKQLADKTQSFYKFESHTLIFLNDSNFDKRLDTEAREFIYTLP